VPPVVLAQFPYGLDHEGLDRECLPVGAISEDAADLGEDASHLALVYREEQCVLAVDTPVEGAR